jgi:hypothetical protein
MSALTTIPTVSEIEQSGEWVCVRNNPHGFSGDRLHDWRKNGCPYAPGRKLRAKQVLVKVEGQRRPDWVWFFRRPTLDKIAPLFLARKTNGKPYFKKTTAWTPKHIKAKWQPERHIDSEGEWLRSGKTCRYLQCKPTTLERWGEEGCVHLGGRCIRWKIFEQFGRDVKYYFVPDLEAVNANRAALTPTPAQAKLILCEDAALELGLTRDTLRTRAEDYGLTKHRVEVRGRNGKLTRKLAFLRKEIKALKKRIGRKSGRPVVLAASNSAGAAESRALVPVTNPEPPALIGSSNLIEIGQHPIVQAINGTLREQLGDHTNRIIESGSRQWNQGRATRRVALPERHEPAR